MNAWHADKNRCYDLMLGQQNGNLVWFDDKDAIAEIWDEYKMDKSLVLFLQPRVYDNYNPDLVFTKRSYQFHTCNYTGRYEHLSAICLSPSRLTWNGSDHG